ncbi:MAG: hypoxanthine phosphoribosyltransferase [Candidatus Atribacteria bacterium]|nr:hypoxanthine phosphoribosyltransferase [Candidatus Atribacteria bacterium]
MNEQEQAQLGERVITQVEIENRVKQVGQAINRDYQGEQPVVVSILKGAVYFTVDLTRTFTFPFDLEFVALSHFKPGLNRVEIEKDLDREVQNRHLLLIEDIVDTGLTLNFLLSVLRERMPDSIRICTFLDCPKRRIADIPVDYRCFEIPDIFVVGYGLDFQGKFRNLLEVWTLFDPSGRSTQILKEMGKKGELK